MPDRTAALKNGRSQEARHKGVSIGFNVELPQMAANPMEVMYNDITAEGYLEVALFSDFVHDIPNFHFQHHGETPVITSLPYDILNKWDIFVNASDLRPKIFIEKDNASLYVFQNMPVHSLHLTEEMKLF